MFRLSREMRAPRWLLILALPVWAAMAAACGYAAVLNHRLTRELISHRWREPTVIVSAAHGPEARVAILYGIDWRVTQPVTLDALPPYVPNAFMAAEDVRFRQHMGVDPIGIVARGGEGRHGPAHRAGVVRPSTSRSSSPASSRRPGRGGARSRRSSWPCCSTRSCRRTRSWRSTSTRSTSGTARASRSLGSTRRRSSTSARTRRGFASTRPRSWPA